MKGKGKKDKPANTIGRILKHFAKVGKPIVGPNAAALQSVQADTIGGKQFCNSGVMCIHITPAIPVDPKNSFAQVVNDTYAEIRERNSGAVNWSPKDLAAYALNVRTLRLLALQAEKVLGAISMVDPNFDFPATVFGAAVGYSGSMEVVRASAADYWNDLALYISQIEEYGVPMWDMYDFDEELVAPVFKDESTRKPSYIAFRPYDVTYYEVSGTKVVQKPVNTASEGKMSDFSSLLKAIQFGINLITGNPINVIIRGDMRNAYGEKACRKTLTPRVCKPVPVITLEDDSEFSLIIENLDLWTSEGSQYTTPAILAPESAHLKKLTDEVDFSSAVSSVIIQFGGVTDPAKIQPFGCDAMRLLLSHRKPIDDAMGMVATLLAPTGERKNDTTKSTYEFKSHVGWIPRNIEFCETMTSTLATVGLMAGALLQNGATAWAMLMRLAHYGHKPLVNFYSSIDGVNVMAEDFDDFALVSKEELQTYHTYAIRSAYQSKRPRGPKGRAETAQ